ncbi:MAG: hypothetical protein FJ098_08095 [Deltaproteobacteria bacterium]|nr:hypothetical protein [Deltaproteobacteria bacterium]
MMMPMECCPGLATIEMASLDPGTGMCMIAMDVFLCSRCGNGTCEAEWENACNCPEDCDKPGDPTGLCAATGGQWTDCGSGCGPWACGEPVQDICPAVCISQCQCPSGDGWDPLKGCVTCSCQDWYATWLAVLFQVTACSTAADCLDVPGTSCGCTHNVVVNKNASLWQFWNVAELMGSAGCSPFMSTCDCPPADGFLCQNGHCTWNYIN